jgi:hypothetical protein
MKTTANASFRISRTAAIDDSAVQDTALIGAVTRRMHTAARIPFSHGELLQATEYVASEGGKYEFHLDADPDVPRLATFIVYLADADGGETIWPWKTSNGTDADGPLPKPREGETPEPMLPYCDSQSYLKVAPRRGRAVLMYNLAQRPMAVGSFGLGLKETYVNEKSLHGSCPVRGTASKWILQKWFRHRPL